MLVSVIIPTYNRQETIERTLDSVLEQSWKNIEIIVVDDGSVDHTAQVLEKFGSRIRLIRQENQGPSAARNTGIRAATGEIISFLDSDDVWMPDKTKRQVELLQQTYSAGVRCCVCNAKMVSVDGNSTDSFTVAGLTPDHLEGIWINPAEVLLTRFLFFNQVVAVWRKTLEQTGYFRSDLRILEDYDLALRLSLVGPWAFINEELVTWYGGAANSLSQNAKEADMCARNYEILDDLKKSDQWGSLLPEPLLQKRLRHLRQLRWAYRQAARPDRGAAFCGKAMLRLLQFQKKIRHRLPGFPRMITQPS